MIKVIVERKLKHGQDIGLLLRDLHMIAFLQKGHISNETMIRADSPETVAIASTWRTVEDWKTWEKSKERAAIVKEIQPFLARKPQVAIYELVSTGDYEYFADPVGWLQDHERPHFEG